jgi:hypothetical protein
MLSLAQLCAGNQEALDAFERSLIERGWCFAEMDEELTKLTSAATAPLDAYFLSNPNSYDHRLLTLGFQHNHDKLSLRWLSGNQLNDALVPKQLQSFIFPLTQRLDDICLNLVEKLFVGDAYPSLSALGEKFELPLLRSEGEARFALFDVARYISGEKVEAKASEDPSTRLSCAEHHDPGLLSISVLSTRPGLQLFDPVANAWIDGPSEPGNVCVIWLGQAAVDASNSKFRNGIHRVKMQSDDDMKQAPRMAMWVEVCTGNQILEGHYNRFFSSSVKNSLEFAKADKLKITSFGDEYIVPVQNGDLIAALRLVEKVQGIPMSKIMKVPVYNDDHEVVDVRTGF